MNWIISLLIYFLGWFICSFSLGNILLILFFSLPLTYKLHKLNIIGDKHPITIANVISLIIQLVIFSSISFVIYKFVSTYFTFYCIGMIIPFFLILNQCGMNENNLQDYLSSFGRFINLEKLEEYFNNKE